MKETQQGGIFVLYQSNDSGYFSWCFTWGIEYFAVTLNACKAPETRNSWAKYSRKPIKFVDLVDRGIRTTVLGHMDERMNWLALSLVDLLISSHVRHRVRWTETHRSLGYMILQKNKYDNNTCRTLVFVLRNWACTTIYRSQYPWMGKVPCTHLLWQSCVRHRHID